MKRNILTALAGILISGAMVFAVAAPALAADDQTSVGIESAAGDLSGYSWYSQADSWLEFKAVTVSQASKYDFWCIGGDCSTGQVEIQVDTNTSKCLWRNDNVLYNGYPTVTVADCELSDNHDKWQIPPNWGCNKSGIVNDASQPNVWLKYNGLSQPATVNPADQGNDEYFYCFN